MAKILIVDDEPRIRELIREHLQYSGYICEEAADGTAALTQLSGGAFDLVILDLGLPDRDGLEFIRTVRQKYMTPIVVLSARTDEMDKIEALDLGANDYITKPFSTGELLARVRAALRLNRYSAMHGGNAPAGEFRAQGMRINYDRRKVFVDEQEIKLTQTEYNIVAFLSQHAGRVMTYAAIVKAIWGDTDCGSGVNFGCGVAIANFNGKEKFRTTIGDGAFLGCNTNLVAPVTIGAGAYTAAGATVTRDVPEDAMLIARAEQTVKPGLARRFRREKK